MIALNVEIHVQAIFAEYEYDSEPGNSDRDIVHPDALCLFNVDVQTAATVAEFAEQARELYQERHEHLKIQLEDRARHLIHGRTVCAIVLAVQA